MKFGKQIACALAIAGVLPVAVIAPARAELTVCNDSASRVGIAVGYEQEKKMVTEGWWNLKPGTCDSIIPDPLNGRFYYLFARDWDKGGTWGGTTPMCTQTKVFTINGIKDCEKRGFSKSDFFEIDTGGNKTWTVRLTEP